MDRACDACGKTYTAKRPSSKFCSDLCRVRNARAPKQIAPPADPQGEPVVGRVTARTAARLTELGMADDPDAAVAMVLAERIDSPSETGAAVASLARQYSIVMEDLRGRGARPVDALDGIADRVLRKIHGS